MLVKDWLSDTSAGAKETLKIEEQVEGSMPPPPALGRGVDAVHYSSDAHVDDLFHHHHRRHFSFVRCGGLPSRLVGIAEGEWKSGNAV